MCTESVALHIPELILIIPSTAHQYTPVTPFHQQLYGMYGCLTLPPPCLTHSFVAFSSHHFDTTRSSKFGENSNLAFLLLSATSSLHTSVNHLYSDSWGRLIVDFKMVCLPPHVFLIYLIFWRDVSSSGKWFFCFCGHPSSKYCWASDWILLRPCCFGSDRFVCKDSWLPPSLVLTICWTSHYEFHLSYQIQV